MQSKPTTEQAEIPWLVKIQQESWQAEIFLSGIIIFTLIKLPKIVTDQFYIIGSQYIAFGDIRTFEYLIRTSIYWLITGFVIHLVLRGIWAGFVGLSYTFPEGIIKEKTGFAPKFQRIIDKIPTPVQSIIALEKYCSALFSIAFLLFMITMGLTVFNLFFNYLYYYLALKMGIEGTLPIYIFNGILIFFTGLYAFDFLTVGLVKKIKWFAPIYYPAYWILNLFTLSFLYRNIYYTVVTNFSRIKIIIAVILYLLVTNFFSIVIINSPPRLAFFDYQKDSFMRARNYENLRNSNQFIKSASIQSDIIADGVLQLFIVYQLLIDDILDDCVTEEEFNSLEKMELRDKKLACLTNFFVIDLNGNRLNNLQWKYYVHPETEEYGIITWIDISELGRGEQMIEVQFRELPLNHPKDFYHTSIPFFKLD